MRKFTYIVLAISMLLSLNSCEWVNTTILGNPSKAEIAKKHQEENARKDSLARIEREAAMAAQRQTQEETKTRKQETEPGKRFHVIVGCFRVSSNAERMISLLISQGYQPKSFELYNGFNCISVQSFDSLREAYNTMTELLRYSDFCPDDVWVYDINDKLHL